MDASYHSLEGDVQEEIKQPPVVRPTQFYHTREAALLPQNERTLNIQRHREREEEKRKVEEENERRLQLEKHKQLVEGKERKRREREEEEMRRRYVEALLLEEERALRDMNGSFAALMREVRGSGEETSVSFAGTNYSPEQMRLFFRALQASRTVTALSLSRRSIGLDGLKLLSEALGRNATLRRLELDAVELNSSGLELLAAGLSTNNALRHLTLSFNPLCSPDSSGVEALAHVLASNDSILCLTLIGCGLGLPDLGALVGCLETNTRLIIVDVAINDALPPDALKRLHVLLDRNNEKYRFARKCEAEERAALALHQSAANNVAKNEQRISEDILHIQQSRTTLKDQRTQLFLEEQLRAEEADRRLEARLEKEALVRAAAKSKKASKAKG